MRQGITAFQEPPTGLELKEDTTVNLVATDTATEIQALIDAQPKNLNGFILLFQFADGTYSLDSELVFQHFSNGALSIYGNASDNSLSASKSVILNFSTASNGIKINNSNSDVAVRYLELNVNLTSGDFGLSYNRCLSVDARYNAVLASATTGVSRDISLNECGVCYVRGNMVSQGASGITASVSQVYLKNNDDVGTLPLTGISAILNSTMGIEGTQPAGSSAAQSVDTSSVIRP